MKRREALKGTAMIAGSAAMTTSFMTLLQSCKEQSRLDWQPRFLSNDHAQLVSSLVDTILPKTDTPGGLDVKVDVFLDLVFDQIFDENVQEDVVAQMNEFNEKCKSKYGKKFHQMEQAQKETVLKEEEANSPKYAPKVWGTAVVDQEPVGFYRSIKSLALWGYFTSEEIGKKVLSYDPIPGDYLGCIPLSDVGKIWSL